MPHNGPYEYPDILLKVHCKEIITFVINMLTLPQMALHCISWSLKFASLLMPVTPDYSSLTSVTA